MFIFLVIWWMVSNIYYLINYNFNSLPYASSSPLPLPLTYFNVIPKKANAVKLGLSIADRVNFLEHTPGHFLQPHQIICSLWRLLFIYLSLWVCTCNFKKNVEFFLPLLCLSKSSSDITFLLVFLLVLFFILHDPVRHIFLLVILNKVELLICTFIPIDSSIWYTPNSIV